MKTRKTFFGIVCAMAVLMISSCGKTNDYKSFIGTWGVEKIEYYNIDYAGNPIPASMSTYTFDPNDTNNGIHLVFREDKTGEMRDSAVDTIWIDKENYIINPDTTVVTSFTYSYDASDKILYMNMPYMRTFKMNILNMTSNSFIYENEYDEDYMEKAFLKRFADTPTKSSGTKTPKRPNKRGSLLGDR